MKVLITGATGFLGEAIVEEFAENEFEVFTTSRKKTTRLNSKKHYQIDITEWENVRGLEKLPKVDVVIHAAGLAHRFNKIEKDMFWRVNVEGTGNIAALAVKIKAAHLVLISTVAVYGSSIINNRNSQPIDEAAVCSPKGSYAESKFQAENTAREICDKSEIKLTVLRPATIIGENDPGNTTRLIRIIDENRFIWVGKGENLKSLIYKRDVAGACRAIVNKRASDNGLEKIKIYNVSAEPLKMREIVGEIAAALNKTIPKFSIPGDFAAKTLNAAEKLTGLKKVGLISETVMKWISEEKFSSRKLRNEIGFKPRISIREAIRREVEFYKSTN